MQMKGIYKITNPNGKIYIGLSTNIEKRWETYQYACNIKHQKLLYNSILKYGVNSHKFDILEIVEDEKLLPIREIFWINELNSYRNGLNMTVGGDIPPVQRGPQSEEHRRKISIANIGKKHTEETKQKIREKRKLQTFTTEQIRKRADKLVGVPSKLKNRKRPNISKALSGKTHTEEHKQKISEKIKKYKVECPHCNKIGGKAIMMRFHFNNCKLKK